MPGKENVNRRLCKKKKSCFFFLLKVTLHNWTAKTNSKPLFTLSQEINNITSRRREEQKALIESSPATVFFFFLCPYSWICHVQKSRAFRSYCELCIQCYNLFFFLTRSPASLDWDTSKRRLKVPLYPRAEPTFVKAGSSARLGR